jgi:hypothetical protein
MIGLKGASNSHIGAQGNRSDSQTVLDFTVRCPL